MDPKMWNEEAWTGLLWFRLRTGGGRCEYVNELSGSIKCGEFLDYLKNLGMTCFVEFSSV